MERDSPMASIAIRSLPAGFSAAETTTLVSRTTLAISSAPLSSHRSDLGIELRHADPCEASLLGGLAGLLKRSSNRIEEPAVFVGVDDDCVTSTAAANDHREAKSSQLVAVELASKDRDSNDPTLCALEVVL